MVSAGVAGLAFAVYSGSASKLVGAGLPPTGVMALLFATAGLLLMPVLLISDTSWLRTPQGLLLAVYLAAVTTAVAYALYGVGLRTVRVRTSAVLSLADPGAAACGRWARLGSQSCLPESRKGRHDPCRRMRPCIEAASPRRHTPPAREEELEMTEGATDTVDPTEVARFEQVAQTWWDPKGPMGTLHKFNPVRLAYIRPQ